jgi:excisionase family DNA binding protein
VAPSEVKVPDLEQFIPHLGSAPAPGAAARDFLETLTRLHRSPRPDAVVPRVESPRPPEARPETPLAPPVNEERGAPPPSPPVDTAPVTAPPVREDAARNERSPAPAPPAAPVVQNETAVTPTGTSDPQPTTHDARPTTYDPRPADDHAAADPVPEPGEPTATVQRPRAPERAMGAIPLLDSGAPPPDLPTIAAIREGLPRTMERLLQIPITEEVAQNSYKLAFRETREELIRRIFDPSLTLEDTARILGVCPTTVRRYTNKGLLRHYRTQGNQRRFRLSDLLAFLEEWGDAGPEAGALGGAASSKRIKTGSPRGSRKTRQVPGGSTDAEEAEPSTAPANA